MTRQWKLPAPMDPETLEAQAQRIDMDDVADMAERAQEIYDRLAEAGPLQRIAAEVRLLVGMVRDYAFRRYRAVPFGAIAAIVVALLYLITPFDLVPDFIPIAGWLDDLVVLRVCLEFVRSDLARYGAWREHWRNTAIPID